MARVSKVGKVFLRGRRRSARFGRDRRGHRWHGIGWRRRRDEKHERVAVRRLRSSHHAFRGSNGARWS